MSALDPKTKEMVSVAVAAANNCLKCLKYHFSAAVSLGCTQQELNEIITIANNIRQRPIGEINQLAETLLKEM